MGPQQLVLVLVLVVVAVAVAVVMMMVVIMMLVVMIMMMFMKRAWLLVPWRWDMLYLVKTQKENPTAVRFSCQSAMQCSFRQHHFTCVRLKFTGILTLFSYWANHGVCA